MRLKQISLKGPYEETTTTVFHKSFFFKEFASFVYLAQLAVLDINVLFISVDLQICS